MEHRSLSPQTLAAQALGETDPATGALAPVITMSTIATHFSGHPALSAVLYPGLPGHPGHAIAARQMDGGFGGRIWPAFRDDHRPPRSADQEHALAAQGEGRPAEGLALEHLEPVDVALDDA